MEMSLHDAEFSSMDPSYLAASALCLYFKLLDGSQWVFWRWISNKLNNKVIADLVFVVVVVKEQNNGAL
jgi:hypothetical protein